MANTVRYGLKNVVYATITYDGSTITYGTPASIPGAVALVLDPEGDITEFFADDKLYYADSNNNGYSGSLEFADVPDEFLEAVFSFVKDTNDVLAESEDVKSKDIAIGFQIDGDTSATKYWLYRVACNRPGEGSVTKEGANEPQTQSFDIRAYGRQTDNLVKTKVILTAGNTLIYNPFLDTVYEPV